MAQKLTGEARAAAGEDFAKLAREVSEDKANAAQGGAVWQKTSLRSSK